MPFHAIYRRKPAVAHRFTPGIPQRRGPRRSGGLQATHALAAQNSPHTNPNGRNGLKPPSACAWCVAPSTRCTWHCQVRADSAELESNFDATVNDLTLCRRDLNVCRSAEQHAAAQCDTTRNQRGTLPTTEGSRNNVQRTACNVPYCTTFCRVLHCEWFVLHPPRRDTLCGQPYRGRVRCDVSCTCVCCVSHGAYGVWRAHRTSAGLAGRTRGSAARDRRCGRGKAAVRAGAACNIQHATDTDATRLSTHV